MSPASGERPTAPNLAGIKTKKEFGAALRALRTSAGLSEKEVAERAGLVPSTISNAENGINLPRTDNLTAILNAGGVKDRREISRWQETRFQVKAEGQKNEQADDPFRGLEFYEPGDAKWFFGRDELTGRLVKRVVERRSQGGMLILTGRSGSGKSSLLRAGLIAKLDGAGGELGAVTWRLPPPLNPGDKPLLALAAHLAELTGRDSDDVHLALRADPACCTEIARQTGTAQGDVPTPQLVLIVDQFEEVFAPGVAPDERSAFIAALEAAASLPDREPSAPAAVVVLGLREDFYSAASKIAVLRAAFEAGHVIVEPMSEVELREAIERPVQAAGGQVEAQLVRLVLDELATFGGNESDGVAQEDPPAYEGSVLPFFSHAMTASWAARQGMLMTLAGYVASGGVHGALAQTAGQVHEELNDSQQELARSLFLRLVRVARDTRDTRRRVTYTNQKLD